MSEILSNEIQKPRRQKFKRNRPIYSCSYCRAKKRKCDQKRPKCTYCVKHNTLGDCEYKGVLKKVLNDVRRKTVRVSEKMAQPGGIVDVEGNLVGIQNTNSESDIRNSMLNANNESDNSNNRINTTNGSDIRNSSSMPSSNSTPKSSPTFVSNTPYSSLKPLTEYSELNMPMVEYLESKIAEFQAQLARLKPVSLSGPQIEEYEMIDFFSVAKNIFLKVNSIQDCKVLSYYYMGSLDPLYYAGMVFIGAHYRVIKHTIKEAKLDSNISYLINPLATALNEDFKTSNYIMIGNHLLDRSSVHAEDNQKRIWALFSIKSRQPGFSLYSNTSKSFCEALILEIEKSLPSLDIVLFLCEVFEKYVHPFVPILDLGEFKKDIELIITGIKFLPGTSYADTYKIYITTFVDLGMVATFLIMLRMAYMAVKINPDLVEPDNPVEKQIVSELEFIGPSYIDLALACLSQCKTMKKGSLVTLGANIFLFHYYSICEEKPNGIVGNEKNMLFNSISALAMSIGLYKDWDSVTVQPLGGGVSGKMFSKDNLVYKQRKMWHYVLRLEAENALYNGDPPITVATNIPLPRRMETPTSSRKQNYVDELIEESYVKLDRIIREIQILVKTIYSDGAVQAKKVYKFFVDANNLLQDEFGDPELYFANDANFTNPRIAQADQEHYIYLVILNKTLRFKQYLILVTQKIKLLAILLNYYDKSNNLTNYLYFFKQSILTTKTVSRFLSFQFVLHNQRFFKAQKYRKLRFFNHVLIRPIEVLYNHMLTFLTGALFRLFNAIYLTHCKLRTIHFDAKTTDRKLTLLVSLKNIVIQLHSTLGNVWYQKHSKFYFDFLREGFLLQGFLKALVNKTEANNRGEPTSTLSIYVGYDENLQLPSCKEDEALGIDIVKMPNTSYFTQFTCEELHHLMDCFTDMTHDTTWIDSLAQAIQGNDLYKTTVIMSFVESRDLFMQEFKNAIEKG